MRGEKKEMNRNKKWPPPTTTTTNDVDTGCFDGSRDILPAATPSDRVESAFGLSVNLTISTKCQHAYGMSVKHSDALILSALVSGGGRATTNARLVVPPHPSADVI